jgi:hypothetical protein
VTQPRACYDATAIDHLGEKSMNEEELRRHLAELTAELESLPPNSPRYQLILNVISALETQLGGDPVESLTEQLEGAVSSFEVEHPRIAAILNNVMVTLTSMGV